MLLSVRENGLSWLQPAGSRGSFIVKNQTYSDSAVSTACILKCKTAKMVQMTPLGTLLETVFHLTADGRLTSHDLPSKEL